MNAENILERFSRFRVWSNRGWRSPYKPLLVIWAIGRCLNGEPRLASFELVDRELARLIRRFGPHRRNINTHHPFWRLQNDGVWEIDRPHLVNVTASGDAFRTDLFRENIHGGLIEEHYNELQGNPNLALTIVDALLASHFPYSLHDDILRELGLTEEEREQSTDLEAYRYTRYRQRDSGFREMALAAYGSQCAVCEFAVRVKDSPVAIEAAHIRWHAANGPTDVRNGLVLCSLHHKLFDYGAFTLLPDLKVFVSGAAGGRGFEEALGKYHGEALRVLPDAAQSRPALQFINWHIRQVFRTPYEIRRL